MDKRQWVVYLVRCSDESLYCGITNNLKNRLIAHNSGRGAKYTKSRRPVELVGASSAMTKSDALKLEYRVKHVPTGSKYYELIKEDIMAKDLNKTLKAIHKDLTALAKKVDKLIIAVGKLEQPKVAKKSKAKVVKRKPVRKAVAKKVAVKKPAAKKQVEPTAADTVLGFIKRYRKGVDVSTLMKKTGFNRRKIYDNAKILKKRGKIKSMENGVYVKV